MGRVTDCTHLQKGECDNQRRVSLILMVIRVLASIMSPCLIREDNIPKQQELEANKRVSKYGVAYAGLKY